MIISNINKLPTIDYRLAKPLQGDLKELSDVNEHKLLNVLNRRGFDVPLFLWRNDDNKEFYLLDGHQRQRVMQKHDLNDAGNYNVPYVLVKAKNIDEARAKLLEITSQYGTITQEGFDWFTADLPEYEYLDINFDALDLVGAEVGEGDITLADGDKDDFIQITFTLHNTQADVINEAIAKYKTYITGDEVNGNSNGNALYYMAQHSNG